ncbi:MAG: protein translocase subunit SecD [Acidimicrobiales bacterium]
MRRRMLVSLVLTTLLAAAALGATLASGNTPNLGLDLQGGASVVLQPEGDVPSDSINQAIEIIRNRVDALGVAEPEITRQGDAIVVQLPGVRDQERALEVVGQTAELRFRPVLQVVPAVDAAALEELSTSTTAPGDPTATTVPGDPSAPTATTAVGGEPAAPEAPSTTVATEGPTTTGAGTGTGTGEVGLPLQDPAPSTTVAPDPGPTTVTTAPADGGSTTAPTAPADGRSTTSTSAPDPDDPCQLGGGTTPSEGDTLDAQITVRGPDVTGIQGAPDEIEDCYVLGPVPTASDGERLIGSVVSSAEARLDGVWRVSLSFTSDGLDGFNETSALCFGADPTCPTQQLAIVLDGRVESAPTIQAPSFEAGDVSISGSEQDPFSEGEAKDLALVLRFGALPVELVPQTVQEVSPTLGRESLDAGVAAGAVGVVAVVLYLLLYYRALGLVVVLSLAVWAALNWSIITYLSASSGLALSLAGVTGLVVSIGVTVDSYIVYFERLKDEVRSGKTLRSSVDRGFSRAFRTILAANVASFIGAATLYVLTVGAVRGFAFFLALATVLDVFVAYFFTRPLVSILARSRVFTEARHLGVARGLGVRRGAAPATATPAVTGGGGT